MKRMTGAVSAAIMVATIASGTAASAAPLVTGDPVLFWSDRAQALLPGSTPVQARSLAMVNIAIHDAVNATVGRPDNAYLAGVAATGGDTRAAASQAARNVLVGLNPGNTAQYDAALTASLALIPDGAAKSQGVATGAAFASAILASRASDGSSAVVSYATTGLPGDYRPTPPANAAAASPQWGDVTPFLMTSTDQFRPGPPPSLDSAAYAAAYNEVLAVGAVGSVTRTADQSNAAKFWASGNATAAWMRIGLSLAETAGKSSLENARALALLSTAMADSQIAGFDAKYEYRLWRPVTAIREGATDGNPGTVADAAWNSWIAAPAHPSYVSTHSTLSAASATILSDVFRATGPFCIDLSFGNRCWSSVDAAALDASDSRIWGGIHFRFDSEAGLGMGRQLGALALRGSAFNAVPEATTWGMMVVGFAGVGVAMRRRRPVFLGSGLVDQSQKMTVAARAMAERKTVGHRS